MSDFSEWANKTRRSIIKDVMFLTEIYGVSQRKYVHKVNISEHQKALNKLNGKPDIKKALDIKAFAELGKNHAP